jgi:putative transposase
MIRAHKIRINPTLEQETYLKKAIGTSRFCFNWGLSRWQEKKEQGIENYGPMALKKEFNVIKREQFPWTMEVTKNACEDGFRRLGEAFKNYYDSKNGKRKGKKVGFINFKSKKYKEQSFTLDFERFRIAEHSLKIQKLKSPINMAEKLRYQGKIKWGTISRKSNKWYISVSIEMNDPKPIEFEHKSVGVDLGINTLATLSDGTEFENQKLLRSELNKLKKLNRSLSRRKQGSSRWHKAKDKLSVFHESIANRRSDNIHKMTNQISKTYRIVGVEDLNVEGMLKNYKLALSLSDVAFGEIIRQIGYKTDWYGGQMVKAGRFFASSKTCSKCGAINRDLKLSDRTWTCSSCGTVHKRDWNASSNLEQEALRLVESRCSAVATSSIIARGQDIRPQGEAVLVEASTIAYSWVCER